MSRSSSVCSQIIIVGFIIHWISFTSTQDIDRLIKHHSDNAIGYEQKIAASFNQPPARIVAPPQVAQATIHSNGGRILPPNNRNELNNFHAFNNPMRASNATPSNARRSMEQSMVENDGPSHQKRKTEREKFATGPQMDSFYTQMRNLQQSNIELALRQTNADENVFQPVPASIGIPDAREPEASSLRLGGLTLRPGDEAASSSQRPEKTEPTTEQSNVIAPTFDPIYESRNQHFESNQPIGTSTLGRYQNEYPSSSGPTAMPESDRSHQNSTAELYNNVVYEGPATVPPPGDFYFSSSERFPNNGKASNVWWSLGIGHEFEKASNLTRDDYLDYCGSSELLITTKQRSLCRAHPKIMAIVARGLKMAIDECQFRFTSNRWNCSLVLQNSLIDVGALSQPMLASKSQPFGEVMKQPNRERSFLNAVVAAGLAHAMTKACSNGELPEECSCDKKIKSKNNRGKIEWVACSDDIDFGARFSRDFIDNTDDESDTVSMINMHNYEVGRRVFKSSTDITCTCQNGENGSCQTKRCWKHLGSFSDIGDELMRRYDSATHVQLSSKDPHKLRPVRRGVRKPKRKDLVYIEESPDYCTSNFRLGVLGTQNRRCNSTSSGPDSCSLLCCGRGYQVVVEEIEEDCNCKFVWCCQVKCDKCRRHLTNDVCN